jgi:hypothetical protein
MLIAKDLNPSQELLQFVLSLYVPSVAEFFESYIQYTIFYIGAVFSKLPQLIFSVLYFPFTAIYFFYRHSFIIFLSPPFLAFIYTLFLFPFIPAELSQLLLFFISYIFNFVASQLPPRIFYIITVYSVGLTVFHLLYLITFYHRRILQLLFYLSFIYLFTLPLVFIYFYGWITSLLFRHGWILSSFLLSF